MKDAIFSFWERKPALLSGLALFLGFTFALQSKWALLPLPLLLHKKTIPQLFFLFCFALFIIYHFYYFPAEDREVEGSFYIHSMRPNERFGKGWMYQGILKIGQKKIVCHTRSSMRISPYSVYMLRGTLKPLKRKKYLLKVHGNWNPIKKRFTWAEWRWKAQQHVKNYIKKHIAKEKAAHFLTGMICGHMEDHILLHSFNQLGLSHLMAVSGFHFGLLALFFHYFLRLVFPQKIESLLLIILLSAYFIFVGNSPSVMRAWVISLVLLIGRILEKKTSPLNSLGVALAVLLIIDPLSAMSLGLHLSFLATAGILLLYPICAAWLQAWLPKYPLKEAVCKKHLWQWMYIFSSGLRDALALTVAVHVAVMPLLLVSFHAISLNSFFYNLFFPFLAGLSLIFFLLSLPFGQWGHTLNGHFCEMILKMIDAPPILFKTYYLQGISDLFLALWLTLLLLIAIIFEVKKRTDRFGISNNPLLNHL
jgi:competence protein ComEC